MATGPLPITTRLQTRDGSSTTKDARVTNVLTELGKDGEIFVIKRPGFSAYDGAAWSAASALGSTALPDGNMISFVGNPAGGINNATFNYSLKAASFATWDPTKKNTHVLLTGGNLIATCDGDTNYDSVLGIFSPSAGKLYYELTFTSGTTFPFVFCGIAKIDQTFANGDYIGSAGSGIGYFSSNGNVVFQTTSTAYGATWTVGDVIGVLYDADARTLSFTKNGTSQGASPNLPTATGNYFPAASVRGDGKVTCNFGASAWAHNPPAGYIGWHT